MTTDVLMIRSQEPPPEWVTALRAISPKSEQHSWLYLTWNATCQRWMLYECVPNAFIEPSWRAELEGPHPDAVPETERWRVLCSRFQWDMYQRFRVNARPCWVIEGSQGGHLYAYDEATKELAKAVGLPPEPPKPGSLPYAPYDARVERQIRQMDKLAQVKNDLAAFRRQQTGDGWKRQLAERKREARAVMVQWLNDQMADSIADFQAAERNGELAAAGARPSDVDWERKDEIATQNFIETGSLSGVG